MSEIRVNTIKSEDGASPVSFNNGVNFSGIATATTFSGNITGVAATFSGDLSVGGTLTYEDVTNIDSVGVITARNGVKTNVSPAITIRDNTTEKGFIGFNGNDPFIGRKDGVGLSFQNNKIRPVDGDDGSASNNTVDLGEPTYKFKEGYFAGAVTAGGLNVTAGISTLSDGLNLSDYLREEVNITAGKLSDNTNIDLENGMVHLFTTTETTTSTPNIRYSASASLDSKMSIGQSVVVTLITTAAAGAYSANITIDGSAVTENWIGGSAPDAGGSSGVDIHTFTIIKTASATFTVIGNHSTTS